MKQRIRLTESDLHRIIKKSVNKILKESIEEASIDKWGDDDYVNYEEFNEYGISGDMREKNFQSALRKGIPYDQLCPMCNRPLKKSYKQLYWKEPTKDEVESDDRGSSSRYYSKPGNGRTPVNVGNTCLKHFEKAHKDRYGK